MDMGMNITKLIIMLNVIAMTINCFNNLSLEVSFWEFFFGIDITLSYLE